jgi:peptidyl-tRNA hydrolase
MTREDDQDPIAMYLIVNEDLIEEMGIGKCSAQVGHAVSMLMLQYHKLDKRYDAYIQEVGVYSVFSNYNQYILWTDWLHDGIRKITLKADPGEWGKLKTEFKDVMVLVRDAGLTILEPGSETVIGLPPMKKSQRPKILQRLQVL